MEIVSDSLTKTQELVGDIAKKLKAGAVLALYGNLGSGKTAFVNFLVAALEINSRVQSPTFVILRKYTGAGVGDIKTVNHFDLYRLTTESEVLDLGLPEHFAEKNAIFLIEWPELAEKYFPADTIRIYFDYVDETTRKVNVQNLH